MASAEERESFFSEPHLNSVLLQALKLQKEATSFCDVIMRICGKELYAHSSILAAASPYFNVFLAQDLPRQFSQRSPQVIEIQIEGSEQNIHYEEALESVLNYIYTGKLRVTQQNCHQIIEIARIMQMNNIVIFCEAFLQGKCAATETIVAPPIQSQSIAVDTRDVKADSAKFKGNKFSSVACLVTPQLLGIESHKDHRDDHTQTSERDFVIKQTPTRTGRPRGRPRKNPLPPVTLEPEGPNEPENAGEDAAPQDAAPQEVTPASEPNLTETAPISVEEETQADVPVSRDCPKAKPTPDSGLRRSKRVSKPTAKMQESSLKKMFSDGENFQTVDNSTDPDVEYSVTQALDDDSNDPDISDMEHSVSPSVDEDSDNHDVSDTEYSPAKRKRGRPAKHIDVEDLLHLLQDPSNPDKEESSKPANEEETIPNEDDTTEENADNENNTSDKTVAVEDKDETAEADDEPDDPDKPEETRQHKASKWGKKLVRKYRCAVEGCGFSTSRVREISNHTKLHRLEQNICFYCENQFDERQQLLQHMDKHKGPLPFFCPVCDLRCRTRTQLSLHLPKHSEIKPFKCGICGARFKWKHAVKSHMLVHSNKKDHLCDICGYATAHKSQLKAHRLIHTGETFKCHVAGCGFQATKKQNLKYHLFSHTGEKPHQCEICGQNFSLVKNLRRHMMLHSEVRHGCDRCQFHTTRVDKLREHQLRQHGIGTPPEKRLRVSQLVMQNFVGTPDEAEAAGLSIKVESERTETHEIDETVAATETVSEVHLESDIIDITPDGTPITGIAVDAEGNQQEIEFLEMPADTIVIQSIEEDGLTLPLVEGEGTVHTQQEVTDSEGYTYTQVMIPVSQFSDFVQHVTYVSQ